MSAVNPPNSSRTAAGLVGATLGTPVVMIDRNGMQALGFLEHYDETLDTFDVLLFDRKAEVTQTTEQSVAGVPGSRFGGFGGHQINTVPVLRVQGAVYLWDPRLGQPRFILAGQNPQDLLDWLDAANKAAQPTPSGDGSGRGPDPAAAINAPSGAHQAPQAESKPSDAGKGVAFHPNLPAGVVDESKGSVSVVVVNVPDSKKGPLPADLPGVAALEAAGITRFKDLRRVNNLLAIAGIDASTAAAIKAHVEG